MSLKEWLTSINNAIEEENTYASWSETEIREIFNSSIHEYVGLQRVLTIS